MLGGGNPHCASSCTSLIMPGWRQMEPTGIDSRNCRTSAIRCCSAQQGLAVTEACRSARQKGYRTTDGRRSGDGGFGPVLNVKVKALHRVIEKGLVSLDRCGPRSKDLGQMMRSLPRRTQIESQKARRQGAQERAISSWVRHKEAQTE